MASAMSVCTPTSRLGCLIECQYTQAPTSSSLSVRSPSQHHSIAQSSHTTLSPLKTQISRKNSPQADKVHPGRASAVRCAAEGGKSGGETAEEGGAGVWVGRAAMMGFVGAIGLEIATGKGLLETIGLSAPLPAVALVLVGVAGVAAAVSVLQSKA